jgi:5-formyltetrahydrofolate cyclo-ligase
MVSPLPSPSAKSALRMRVNADRARLDDAARVSARAQVRAHLLTRFDELTTTSQPWRRVFGYDPLPSEPGSAELLDALADRGAEVFVPILRPDKDLDWTRWGPSSELDSAEVASTAAASSALGVDAIRTADVVLVPALAVDGKGMRLGRGGGSYDRALARVSEPAVVIALLHRGEVVTRVPTESWDRAVDLILTPDGWFTAAR